MKTLELVSERKRKGLTQADISKLLDLSEVSYRSKELGKYDFNITELKKIIIILGLSDERIKEIFLT